MPGEASLQQVARDRKELLEKIEALGNVLPKNSLDQLINELGGPSQVAEVHKLIMYLFDNVIPSTHSNSL